MGISSSLQVHRVIILKYYTFRVGKYCTNFNISEVVPFHQTHYKVAHKVPERSWKRPIVLCLQLFCSIPQTCI